MESFFDKWLYLLKHIHEMVEIPKEFTDPFFKRLFMLAEIDNFTAEEKEQYEKSLNSMGDWENILNSTAELERAAGYEQGMQQGIQQGRRENSLETARKLKALGVAVDVIAQSTDLPVEEIEDL